MSAEELKRYEADLELRLYREYRDVSQVFEYAVDTERRFYLANEVTVDRGRDGGQVELTLTDAWVWDMFRPARFVAEVRVLTGRDVTIERLAATGRSEPPFVEQEAS
jgi:hypothetical protein